MDQKLANQVLHNHSNNVNIVNKLKALRKVMEKEFDFFGQEISEEVIDVFVDSIIVYYCFKQVFKTWGLDYYKMSN